MYELELKTAREAARAGAVACMRHFGTARADYKEGGSPVTAADHASNDAVLATLRRTFPDDAILSEESRPPLESATRRRLWVIDPLDGTKEFLAGLDEFAVMVALAVDGRPEVAAICMPRSGRLYSARAGAGAWMAERGGAGRRLSSAPADPNAIRVVHSRSHADPVLDRLRERLPVTESDPCGSVGVKCIRVAEGRSDLYVHPVPYLKEWDTCAPELVLREAGGEVTDCLGRPLTYGKERRAQPNGILACARGLFARVLPVATEMLEQAKATSTT